MSACLRPSSLFAGPVDIILSKFLKSREIHEKNGIVVSRTPSWTPELISHLVDGRWVNADQFQCSSIATSSKKRPESTLFITYSDKTFRRYMGDCNFVRFAAPGRRFNNRRALKRAVNGGWVGAVITDREVDVPVPQLVVEDSFAALETLAKYRRSLVKAKVVAVTGTVGKSSTLKALDSVLGKKSRRLSKGNVRRSLALGMANAPILDENTYLLAEVSVSALWGEDSGISQVLRPDVAVLTEVGLGMTHRVPNVRETAVVKSNLLDGMHANSIFLYNAQMDFNDYVAERAERQGVPSRSFGFGPGSDYRIVDEGPVETSTGALAQKARILCTSGEADFSITALGKAHLYANSAAIAVADCLGEDLQESANKTTKYRASKSAERISRVPDRRLNTGHNLVDGTFSATPLSMRNSFELASQVHSHSKDDRGELIAAIARVVALGDQADKAHIELAKPLTDAGFDRIYTYGPDMAKLAEALTERDIHGGHFDDIQQLADALTENLQPNSTILLKGSKRASDFREVRKHLAKYFEIDIIAISARIEGKVQGVGFRKWARTEALRGSVVGWIRNAGASVEMRAQGERRDVLRLLNACQQGPDAAEVEDVISEEVPLEKISTFRIRKNSVSDGTSPHGEKMGETPEENRSSPIGPRGFESSVVFQAFGSQKLSAFTLALESWRRGLTVRIGNRAGTSISVRSDKRTVSFSGSRSSLTSRDAVRTVDDKHKTIELLRNAHLPVPQSRPFDSSQTTFDDLLSVATDEYNWPVVLKPVSGSRGDGVFANISSADELRQAHHHLTHILKADRILLEEHIAGDDYRIYVVGDRVVGACRRIPANVVGDGRSTVRELIKAKNSLRKQNPFLSKGLIRPDVEIDDMLSQQGLGYTSIPGEGKSIQLRQKANASAGGDVEDMSDELPTRVAEAAVASVNAIDGLAAAGVDVLINNCPDQESGSFAIIELNARAHIGVNMYPTHGGGANVPRAIIDHFFPESRGNPDALKDSLVFNLDETLGPLRTGSASHVEVSRLPEHSYPVRLKFAFNKSISLSNRQINKIMHAVDILNISASLTNDIFETSRLVVSGENTRVQDFLSRASHLLGENLPESEEWKGTVIAGFHIRR